MKYILRSDIALRTWEKIPRAFYRRGDNAAQAVSEEAFELLLRCDGEHDLPDSGLLRKTLEEGIIVPAEDGAALSRWQRYRFCPHRYVPTLKWAITGKCNYNCLHCFNAADNTPLQSEFSWDEIVRVLDEAQDCGVQTITLTGGEPMLHPRFTDILRGIYERGMDVQDINTNGWFITDEILEEIKKLTNTPRLKISFDGVGFHNWMRGNDKAEERTLEAVRLCVKHGIRPRVQINFNRRNKASVLPTLELMEAMGVSGARVIMTTETPRWRENAAGQSFTFEEFYEEALTLAESFMSKSHKIDLDIWQFISITPRGDRYELRTQGGEAEWFKETRPICGGIRSSLSIASNGEVYPCMQMSGFCEKYGISYGNIKTTRLHELLKGSDYIRTVCTALRDKISVNAECAECEYLKLCKTGCPAIALLTSGDLFGTDKTKCVFYKKGYYDRVKALQKRFCGVEEGFVNMPADDANAQT